MKFVVVYALDMDCDNITVRSDSQILVLLLNSTETHINVDVLLKDIR